jgi:hypothetical protein
MPRPSDDKLARAQAAGRFKTREAAERAALEAYVQSLEARGVIAVIEADTEDDVQRAVRVARLLGGHRSRAAAIDAALDYYLSTFA